MAQFCHLWNQDNVWLPQSIVGRLMLLHWEQYWHRLFPLKNVAVLFEQPHDYDCNQYPANWHILHYSWLTTNDLFWKAWKTSSGIFFFSFCFNNCIIAKKNHPGIFHGLFISLSSENEKYFFKSLLKKMLSVFWEHTIHIAKVWQCSCFRMTRARKEFR